MKLRIRNNSIRLRLTKKEVEALADQNTFEAGTDFLNRRLVYKIDACDVAEPSAAFSENMIKVLLPVATVKNWCATEEVGIYAKQSLPDSKELQIIVEKDFACLTRREGEDDSDAYENPNHSC